MDQGGADNCHSKKGRRRLISMAGIPLCSRPCLPSFIGDLRELFRRPVARRARAAALGAGLRAIAQARSKDSCDRVAPNGTSRIHGDGAYHSLAFCGVGSLTLPPLTRYANAQAMALASVFGSDWLRLDFFIGHPKRGWQISEVSYPSHQRYPQEILDHWVAGYGYRSDLSHRPSLEQRTPSPGTIAGKHDVPHVQTLSNDEHVLQHGANSVLMWQVDGECVADYLLRLISVDPERFAKNCVLCSGQFMRSPPSLPTLG